MNGTRRIAALGALCGVLATPARAQAPAASPSPSPVPAPASASAPALSAPAPPATDGALRALAGSWDVAMTLFVRGQPPVKLTGTSENAWVLGGRFLQSTFTITGGGTTVEGLTTYGFNRDRQEYFAVSVNTSKVPYGAVHGPFYEGSRSFVLRSEAAGGRGLGVKQREMIRLEGDDRHVVEVFLEAAGKPPAKVVEAVFTRR